MKRIVIVMFCLLIVNRSSSQAGASIVYDPTNGVSLSNMLATLDELKEKQEEWKSSQEFLDKVVSEGKEVKRLVSLLESLVCATDEFEIYIGVVGNLTLCNRKLNIDITLSKIEGISSKVKNIATGAYVLSQFETIESLKQLNDELEEGIRQMNDLNTNLKLDVIQSLNAAAGSTQGHKSVSWSESANI